MKTETAVVTVGGRRIPLPPCDLALVRRSPDALRSLRRLIVAMRSDRRRQVPSDTSVACRLAAGWPVPLVELGAIDLDPLERVGAVKRIAHHALSGIRVDFLSELAIVSSAWQRPDERQVYLGHEAPWLVRLAWDHGPGSGRAADLAAGTGVVGAALSSRYRHVVVSDILPEAVDAAALTLAVNRGTRSSTWAIVADGGRGLRPEAFDLITANAPWVPSARNGSDGADALYAHGGPTGLELPRRIAWEALAALGPGGVAIVLACDTSWRDGTRPLVALVDELGSIADVDVVPAPRSLWGPTQERDLLDHNPDVTHGSLVALVITKPQCLGVGTTAAQAATPTDTTAQPHSTGR